MKNPAILEGLKQRVEGLLYPSESDEPFDLVCWDNPQPLDVAKVLESRFGKGRRIRSLSPEEFFAPLREADDAERYESLHIELESSLKDLRIFRVGDGEVRVDVYLLGTDTQYQAIVGLHTVSVET